MRVKNTKQRKRNLQIPFLMYHEVTDKKHYKILKNIIQYSYILDKEDFKAQILYLKENDFITLSVAEACLMLRSDYSNKEIASKKYIVLTFDDGYHDNHEYVFPILLENGFVGNFFIVVNKIENKNMLSWSQIVEMDRYGMNFGSHTMNHLMLGSLSQSEIAYELIESKKILEDRLGKKISYLSLPHGSYNKAYRSIASKAGYSGGCTSDPGLNSPTTYPFFLKRMNVPRNASIDYFVGLCEKQKYIYGKVLAKKKVITIFKKIFGESLYLNMYNKLFGVNEP